MRRKSPFPIILLFLVLILSVVAFFVLFENNPSPKSPEEVIEDFYHYEQDGDFGNAWELFHTEMKKKFPKSLYIQTKNHVFMGHMGVETFDVKVGALKKLKKFTFSKDGLTFKDVRKAEVDLYFDSQFGKLTISQDCYVAKEKGEWKVLWDYNF